MRCGNGIRFFTKPHVAKAKADLSAMFQPFGPSEPLKGALRLRLDFRFPMRKSETKARRALGVIMHDKRPDLDNLAKLTIDVMAGLNWFRDDAQISRLELSKSWSISPGISGKINVI
jgi:Holliday junction resolvase RusA-like endonuclease